MSAAKNDPREPLANVPLSRTILDALELAAQRSAGAPLGTLHILTALLAVDGHAGWETLQLRSTYLDPADVARLSDPDPRATACWGEVPVTASAAGALAYAAQIAHRHELEPMPVGVLVLGLVSDSSYAASRALLEESAMEHGELIECVQEELLGTSLDLDGAAREQVPPGRLAGLARAKRAPTEEPQRKASAASIAAACHLRARAIEAREDPGSLALLIAALELSDEPELNALLGAMLLDAGELTALLAELGGLEDIAAVDILVRAKARTEGPLDAAALIAAVALGDSARVREALRRRGISSAEVAAQMTEWFVCRASPSETTPRMLVSSLLTLAAGVATSVLLLLNAAESSWLKALLLIPVWFGYPQEGPVFGSVVAVVLAVLVSPLVAGAQALSVLCEIAQADSERFARWARTGVRLTLREQRHVTMRLINGRGRTMRQLRQSILLHARSGDESGGPG